MNKEIISDKQGIYLVALFVLAETLVLTRAMEAKRDFWFAIILAIIISIPFTLMFYRLHSLYPKKDLFDINECVLGKILGKIISFLLIYYVASNMMSVMHVFNDFMHTASLEQTPEAVLFIALTISCIFIVKYGIEVMARWTELFFPVILVLIFIGIILLIPQMNINNIRPFLREGVKPVMEGTLTTVFFPLTETIAFVMIFAEFKTNKSPKRIYSYGLIIGGLLILMMVFVEVTVIGVTSTIELFFPGYETFSRLNIADFIQRLEIISGATFVLGGFLKISVLLLAVSRGFAKIFNFTDYRFIVTPTALIIANISYFFYDSTIFMFEWISEIWGYFAFPFQFVLPIMIWIVAEIRNFHLAKQRN